MIKVTHVMSDANIGGVGTHLAAFLQNYDKTRFNMSVALPVNSKTAGLLSPYAVDLYETEGINDKSLSATGVLNLIKLLRRIKPDIVHAHACMSARIAAKLLGIKTVFTRHSVFDSDKNGLSAFINNLLADKAIAVAEAAKLNLISAGIHNDKITVIYNGTEPIARLTDEEKRSFRQKHNIPENAKVATIMARLNKVKGHMDFIDAARLSTHPNTVFLIAGAGEEEDNIKQRIKELNLGDKVLFLGFVKGVAPLLNITDVQVNCSFGTEASSLSLLEGMSAGIPAVVTDYGGNAEVITHGVNGYVTPIHSPECTAQMIDKVLSNDNPDMKNNCIKIYSEKFTSKVMARNMEDFYLSV